MLRQLSKIAKYRLRLWGCWPNTISRARIARLEQAHSDIDIVWTGKEYPAGPVDNFRGLRSIDATFRTIVMAHCARVIGDRRPTSPLVFCRTEHELFWLMGLSACGMRPVAIGDCDLRMAQPLGFSYVHADLLSLPFDDGAFDLVAIPHFLYYAGVSFVPESRYDPNGDEGLLREINRVLRPGGTLVGMAFVRRGGTVLPVGFQRARDLDGFREMLRRCGFGLAEETLLHRASMKEICAEEVSSAMPKYTRPGEGFADRMIFVGEKVSTA